MPDSIKGQNERSNLVGVTFKSLNFNQYAALLDLYACEDEGDAGDWLEHVQQLVSSFSDEQIELFSHIN